MLQRYEWRVTPKEPIPLIDVPIKMIEWGGFAHSCVRVDTAFPAGVPDPGYQGRNPKALENSLRLFQPARKR